MPLLGHAEEARSYRAPVIGDHVISHHQQWAYYAATIVSFDRETLKYTVDWDDGDPTGKVQSYKVCREIRCILGKNRSFYWREINKLLIVKADSCLRNVYGIVWRMWILMLECEGQSQPELWFTLGPGH